MTQYEGIWLNDGEEVICKLRKSMLAALSGVIGFVIFLILGIVIFATGGVFRVSTPTTGEVPVEAEEMMQTVNRTVRTFRIMNIAYGCSLIFIGALILLCVLLSLAHVKLILTNRRVIGSRGVFSRSNIDIPISKVDAINISRSLFGAILGYQSVQVLSPSTTAMSRRGKGAMFRYAKNATEFKNAVLQVIDQLEKKEKPAQ